MEERHAEVGILPELPRRAPPKPSGDNTITNWKKGCTKIQQMYITEKYCAKYYWDSYDEIIHMDVYDLQEWKEQVPASLTMPVW